METIESGQVFQEPLADLPRGSDDAVEIDVLSVAIIGSDTDDIALVGDNVDQLSLAIEASDGRKLLPERNSFEKQSGDASANRKLAIGWAIQGEPQ